MAEEFMYGQKLNPDEYKGYERYTNMFTKNRDKLYVDLDSKVPIVESQLDAVYLIKYLKTLYQIGPDQMVKVYCDRCDESFITGPRMIEEELKCHNCDSFTISKSKAEE